MLLATIILLTAVATIVMIYGAAATPEKSGDGSVAAAIAMAVFAATALMGVLGWNDTGDVFGALRNGPIASLGVIILSVIGLLVTAGAAAHPAKYRAGPGEFFGFVIFTVLGGILMVASSNLLVLYLGIELSSYSTYILVGYYRDDRYSNEAASKYFLLGAVASALLLFGIALTYAGTVVGAGGTLQAAGSLDYTGIAQRLQYVTAQLGQPLNPLIWPGLALILAGFGFKLALVPFHSWTPDAYQGAPSMVAALLSVGPKAASIIALASVLTNAFNTPQLVDAWRLALIWLAILSMTIGNLQAMNQTNVKRLLGYSSIAQLGYILIGVAVAAQAGFTALIFYVAGYALTNIGAFTTISALRDAGVGEEIEDYAGLVHRSPAAAVLLGGFFMSLAGVPLLAGFLGKLLVFKSAVDAGLIALVIVAVINTVFAYYYYFRVIVQAFLAEPRATTPVSLNPTAVTALTVALAGVLLLGIYPTGVLGFIESAVKTLPVLALR
ncbi:MAG TPA: NADH-quinone oxidoreductase subunit N [Deinococcales bacterium]|nr:NADH-quinone oxidoreductase subunit N [Deinococcales bacterium]